MAYILGVLVLVISFQFFPSAVRAEISRFTFVTSPQTIVPNAPSEVITVRAENSSGDPVAVGTTACLHFDSSSSSGEFSTNRDNWSAISATHMSSNWSQRNFYYKDSAFGQNTMTVKIALRPDGAPSCASWPISEWNVQWTASQGITTGESSNPVSSSSSQVTLPSASSISQSNISIPSIKANAGEDKTVSSGSLVEFKGTALGLKNEILENASFWWNFGDGNSKTGRIVNHIFKIPGNYTVGLHVSSGEYSASDFVIVTVASNQLEVSLVISGEEGYIGLANKGKSEIDIGGWILEDGEKSQFIIPLKTKIGAQAQIAFLNSVTNLFLGKSSLLLVRYPNGSEAMRWSSPEPVTEIPLLPPKPQTAFLGSATVNSSSLEKDIEAEEKVEKISEKSEESQNTAQASGSRTGGSLKFFLGIALLFSLMASAGFIAVRRIFL